jgi:hypothetical protein
VKSLKNMIFGLILGIAVGLWFGVNLGKDKPLLSNPFAGEPVKEQLKKTGGQVLEKGGEALQKGGEALEKGGQALQDQMEK